MKNQILLYLTAAMLFLFVSSDTAMVARAANDNYVTITVDATDDSGSLQYAIDNDAPEAFSDKSSFQVIPGSTHTIYVKDSAGNVTSQEYSIPVNENESEESRQDSPVRADASVNETYGPGDERKVNIDVNLANGAFTSSGTGSAAEDGGGTLYDKEKTDGTDASGKVFYTVTTKEGEVFYLVVDQNRSDNNVYLLTQATVNDLQYLADQNNYNFTVASTGQSSQSLLNMLSGSGSQGTELSQQPGESSAPAKSKTNSTLLLGVLVVIGGGGYYIFKTKKNRREKQMDEIDSANDLQDYEIEDDMDEDELGFDETPVEQEKDWYQKDEELRSLMELDTETVFGEEGENEAVFENEPAPPDPSAEKLEMGLEDYDEFGESSDDLL